ncbi:MAG: glycosyltransferase [Chthoniobacter sp.]|uniref:glycosyltransferase n=1 Tax=Chthoniobacter sp. TaxID=2510640 RepID=UPI0032A3ECAE
MSEPTPHHDSPPPRGDAPVAAQYLATFLKPEMLHIYRQITALHAFRPVVLCQNREQPEAFPFDDVRLLPKPRTRALRRIWQKQILGRPITLYRSEAQHLANILREIRAQVLHVYFGHMGVHLLPLLEISPVPIIVSFHGADAGIDLEKPAHLAMTRRMLDRATLLLVRSESLAQRLTAIGADARKIRLHRTGIPLGEISFQQRSAPPDGAWRCVQACRLIAKKGLATTLRAFAEFGREFPQATLSIAGEGPQLAELQALAKSLGIAGRVAFPGFLSQVELRALYASAHFFLHPSETPPDGDQEGVPNSMLEAMASGLPVLATTHGGIPEAVEHGASGWLVPERDHTALAQAWLALARHPTRYAQMSAAAVARVAAAFDLTAQARLLESYYREAGATLPKPTNAK